MAECSKTFNRKRELLCQESIDTCKKYEKEILELREQGLTQRETASRFGVSYEKMHDFSNGVFFLSYRIGMAGIICKPKRSQ